MIEWSKLVQFGQYITSAFELNVVVAVGSESDDPSLNHWARGKKACLHRSANALVKDCR